MECAQPDSPIRALVAPGDEVHVKLVASWTTARRIEDTQTLFDGAFTVPAEVHKMGAPGYSVDVPHLGTMMYFCVGRIGTAEESHLEILSWHLTLLY